jgi:hypothetical protein
MFKILRSFCENSDLSLYSGVLNTGDGVEPRLDKKERIGRVADAPTSAVIPEFAPAISPQCWF